MEIKHKNDIQNNNISKIKKLIRKGTDVNTKCADGDTALIVAEKSKNNEIITLFKKYGAK